MIRPLLDVTSNGKVFPTGGPPGYWSTNARREGGHNCNWRVECPVSLKVLMNTRCLMIFDEIYTRDIMYIHLNLNIYNISVSQKSGE